MEKTGRRRGGAVRCLCAALFWLSLTAIASAQTDPGPVDLSTRQGARVWFNKWWPLSHNADMGFTGDVSKGIPGDTSQAFKDNVALRINIFRRMAGLQPITFHPTYNAKDQIAAMMMSANNQITHYPPSTWKFYSAEGADAAQKSDLAIDFCGPQAIVGYMYDWGPLNDTAPHRTEGIIFPATTSMGTGDVPESDQHPAVNAFWNSDISEASVQVNHAIPILPWPSKGYIPHFLIPGRWTLFVPDLSPTAPCDLSRASVSVTKDGVALSIKVSPSPSGAILVWTLDGTDEGDTDTIINNFSYQNEVFGWARPKFQVDVKYHVVVDGIRIPHFDADGNELGDGPNYNGAGVTDGRFEYDVIGYDPDIAVVDPNNQSNLINISTRSFAGTGSSTQIAGFIVGGFSPRKVLIRAGGPYLSQFGVTNALIDPVLTLYDGVNRVLSNDDWGQDGTEIRTITSFVGAVGFAEGSTDAAIVATLQPGHAYTAQVNGKNGATGNTIVEVYDADTILGSRLINISTRSFVGKGEDIQIGGFILRGGGPRKVLIRAGGPYLKRYGVSDTLADPVLTVFQKQTVIASNDDWDSEGPTVESAVQSVGVPPFDNGSKDAAVVLTLDPDVPYTAQVSGKEGTTGNALVEIFQLP